jgi:ADP-heptose:LPS heptosyltransferase
MRGDIAAALLAEQPTIIALLFRRVGDSLMATPALRGARAARPQARIIVIAEEGVKRIFEGNPSVSEIVPIPHQRNGLELLRVLRLMRRQYPQITLDFLSDPRSAFLSRMSGAPVRVGIGYPGRRWAYTRCIPCQDPQKPLFSAAHKLQLSMLWGDTREVGATPDFFLKPEDEQAASRLWENVDWHTKTNAIAFGVHSRREHKRWPLERFAEVARRLIQAQNISIALIAGPGEQTAVQQVQQLIHDNRARIVVPNGLGVLAACLKRCRIFIGNDGGPKHLAVAVGKPTLTLFGAEPSEFWTPAGDPRHVALGGIRSGKLGIESLTADEVFESARRLYESAI